jgi:uncharacterized protein (TIGR02147 family)
MKKTLFDFNSYREYLRSEFPTRGEKRGGRVKLAEFIGVQKAFLSAVLNGKLGLNLEQALRVSQYLGHRKEEREYFLLLVQEDRAGSNDLKTYFRDQINKFILLRTEIQERIAVREALAEKDQMIYYSSWYYTAIHMCLMISHLQTPDAISKYLGLSRDLVIEILEFFSSSGLAKRVGSTYQAGPARLHIPADSPFVQKHHANWRLQALHSIERRKKDDLHYSLVMSISADGMRKIREILTQSIESSEVILQESKDEGVYALTIDLFDINSN